MSKKGENSREKNENERKKKMKGQGEQKEDDGPKTPDRKLSEDVDNHFFNLMSPFQLPPKFNVQFTAASMGNYGFSHDMKVIQTPYQHRPNAFKSVDLEDMGDDLRQITGKIDWGNTPQKTDPLSSEEEEESSHTESSGTPLEEMQLKQEIDEKSIEEQQNPENVEKQAPPPVQKQFQPRIITERHFTKRISHQKKLLEQFIAPEVNASGKKVFCNCKKTKCIKLYCDCFRINQTCDGCNCQGCHNLEQYAEQRNNAIMALMDRNPDPFSIKIHEDKHLKGCNCRKSKCLKKYCECYQADLKCGENCKCDECENGGGSEQRERDRQEREGMRMEKEIDGMKFQKSQ